MGQNMLQACNVLHQFILASVPATFASPTSFEAASKDSGSERRTQGDTIVVAVNAKL